MRFRRIWLPLIIAIFQCLLLKTLIPILDIANLMAIVMLTIGWAFLMNLHVYFRLSPRYYIYGKIDGVRYEVWFRDKQIMKGTYLALIDAIERVTDVQCWDLKTNCKINFYGDEQV